MADTALITDIQHFSLHDGPGIRTTVFFKGCPLQCRWCHNPEAISFSRELLHYKQFCTLCGSCIESCPQHCISMGNQEIIINRSACTACGNCVETCMPGAMEVKGTELTIDKIVYECMLDSAFYKATGGVTLSGGEPLSKGDFLFELMKELKSKGLNIVLDTCGFTSYELLAQAKKYADTFYFDLKCITNEKHKLWTGRDNAAIKENLKRLIKSGADITVRIPVIPGFNATEDEFRLITDFLEEDKDKLSVHLLPYHNFGSNKYNSLGKEYRMDNIKPPAEDLMNSLLLILTSRGLNAEILKSV